ncbi:hypothetical protein [Streptomyces mirabilis]|uniref:hypothetical protein n=1 Tax=Streptomyces mirabilis TaxID=68239 RepID=UPI0036B50824
MEYATLGWNVVGVMVLAVAAISARSVALAGFGLDSGLAPRPRSAPPGTASGSLTGDADANDF